MAYGTPRTCPLLIEPTERTMSRWVYRQMDHALRLVWRNHREELTRAATDMMIYGGLPEPDGVFRGRSLLSVVEALGKPVSL